MDTDIDYNSLNMFLLEWRKYRKLFSIIYWLIIHNNFLIVVDCYSSTPPLVVLLLTWMGGKEEVCVNDPANISTPP